MPPPPATLPATTPKGGAGATGVAPTGHGSASATDSTSESDGNCQPKAVGAKATKRAASARPESREGASRAKAARRAAACARAARMTTWSVACPAHLRHPDSFLWLNKPVSPPKSSRDEHTIALFHTFMLTQVSAAEEGSALEAHDDVEPCPVAVVSHTAKSRASTTPAAASAARPRGCRQKGILLGFYGDVWC